MPLTVDNMVSEFITEIKELTLDPIEKGYRECPKCGGRMVFTRTKYEGRSDFYGCSNYYSRGCTYTEKIKDKT